MPGRGDSRRERRAITDSTPRALAAEFIGTFCFLFVGVGAISAGAFMVSRGGDGLGLVAIALANGLALAAMITAFNHISGAHFNPAVTVAVFVCRRIDFLHGVLYIVAQLTAATLAGFTLRAVFPSAVWQSVNLGATAVAADIPFGTAILIEAILTFILVMAIFGTAMDPRAAKVGGFAIGVTVTAATLMGGPLTGAAMNPARAFGPAVAANFWNNHPVYWIGPLCGAVIAGLVYGWYLMDARQGENAT